MLSTGLKNNLIRILPFKTIHAYLNLYLLVQKPEVCIEAQGVLDVHKGCLSPLSFFGSGHFLHNPRCLGKLSLFIRVVWGISDVDFLLAYHFSPWMSVFTKNENAYHFLHSSNGEEPLLSSINSEIWNKFCFSALEPEPQCVHVVVAGQRWNSMTRSQSMIRRKVLVEDSDAPFWQRE